MAPPHDGVTSEVAPQHFFILRPGTKGRKGTPTWNTALVDPGESVLASRPLLRRGRLLFSFRRCVAAVNPVILVVSIAACSDSNEPGPDPGPGRILFTRAGNGLVDIYAIDARRTNLQQLTASFALDERAAWSPDTLKILFQSDRIPDTTYTARFQIYVMNSDGSSLSQLTFPDPARDSTGHVIDTTSNFHPAWSPDGTKIAFASTRDTNPEIYVMNADGSQQVDLTNHGGSDLTPAWSPDGTRIAFQSDRSTNYAVWLMNADGSNPVRLTDPAPPSGAPSWSPDGTRIAYEQDGDIWVMNTDGTRKIATTGGFWEAGLHKWRPIL